MKLHPRVAFGAIVLFAAGLLATALFLQHVKQMEPCPLCIMQRYAYLLVATFALLCWLHRPQAVGRAIYSALITLAALAGGGIALRQVLLIHFPPEISECGPGLEAYLDKIPLTHLLPWLFKGTGDCAADNWRLMGLAIPEWSLLCFLGLTAVGLTLLLLSHRSRLGRTRFVWSA